MNNNIDIYNVNFVDNNITYSIDMITLKTYITYSKFSEIEFLLQTAYKDKVKKFWISDRPMCFHYNYCIEFEEGKSFFLDFLHNSEKVKFHKENGVYNLTIKFNPNKLRDNSFIFFVLGLSGDWYLRGYDMAFDLRINILDLITDMSGRSLENIENRGFDNKTIYIGVGDGRVKIYNKKRESKLNILGDYTRVEISREVEDFEIRKVKILNYDNKFPIIYLNNYVYSFSDYKDKTTLALLYAVQNGFPLRDLSRAYKTKIKKMLEGGHKIRFSNNTATMLLRKTIFYYFMQNPKISWW